MDWPGTQLTWDWNWIEFKKKLAKDLAQKNSVDLEGRLRTHKTQVKPRWDLTVIYIYIYIKRHRFIEESKTKNLICLFKPTKQLQNLLLTFNLFHTLYATILF